MTELLLWAGSAVGGLGGVLTVLRSGSVVRAVLGFWDRCLNRRAVMRVWARSGDPGDARAVAEALRIVNDGAVRELASARLRTDPPVKAA